MSTTDATLHACTRLPRARYQSMLIPSPRSRSAPRFGAALTNRSSSGQLFVVSARMAFFASYTYATTL